MGSITKRVLTAEEVQIVRDGAAAGRRRDDIAAAIGVTPYILTQRMRDQLGGLKLPRGTKRGGLQEWPSPEEVELRKIEVRAKWSRARWGLDGKNTIRPGGGPRAAILRGRGLFGEES